MSRIRKWLRFGHACCQIIPLCIAGTLFSPLATAAQATAEDSNEAAVALVYIAPNNLPLLPDDDCDAFKGQFEVYKATQAALYQTYAVLRVYREYRDDPNLPILRRADFFDWISRHLEVSFPKNGAIMHVVVTGSDSAQLLALLTRFHEAYQFEAVEMARAREYKCIEAIHRRILQAKRESSQENTSGESGPDQRSLNRNWNGETEAVEDNLNELKRRCGTLLINLDRPIRVQTILAPTIVKGYRDRALPHDQTPPIARPESGGKD